MSQESKQKMSRQKKILIFALIVLVILILTALTRAWLFENKGLQTMTKIQAPYLYLRDGQNDDSIPVELGEIDVRKDGEKRVPFRVVTSKGAEFKLQLGHTTNLPLEYKIIEVSNWNKWESTVAKNNIVEGGYLNQDSSTNLANESQHKITYGEYNKKYVQKSAEPLYWQSKKLSTSQETEHKYILIVSWNKCDEKVIDKDTEMIYLTAGIVGGTDETN